MSEHYKRPRIYKDTPLKIDQNVILTDMLHHYLKNVLRVQNGDRVRIFNGRDGEFLSNIDAIDKKTITLTAIERIKEQPAAVRKIHLLFAPIKKERMDWMIEKAVELGASDLHIVLTQNTDIRKFNEERMTAQIIEAAEQCERLDIPSLHTARDLFTVLSGWNSSIPLFAALERFDANPLPVSRQEADCAILIGPSGGFTQDEKERIASQPFVKPVSLGDNILRTETAALAALSLLTR